MGGGGRVAGGVTPIPRSPNLLTSTKYILTLTHYLAYKTREHIFNTLKKSSTMKIRQNVFGNEQDKKEFLQKVIDKLHYCDGFKMELELMMLKYSIPENVKIQTEPKKFNYVNS